MRAFEIPDLVVEREQSKKAYLEFLRVPELSAGLYYLAAGGTDPQGRHAEDEVYYVVRGRGRIRVSGEDREIIPGSVIFVAKNAEHKFHSIEEDLTTLVFFAPAEHSRAVR